MNRPAPLGIFILMVLLFPAGLSAQDRAAEDPQGQDPALLLRGPSTGEGIPFLPSNVIKYHAGLYQYRERHILLFYTEKEIIRFTSWQPASCRDISLANIPEKRDYAALLPWGDSFDLFAENSSPAVYFFAADDYSLFFVFEDELQCTFVERFLNRFEYFRGIRDIASSSPPFPAVVE